jgi:hypothetical protein
MLVPMLLCGDSRVTPTDISKINDDVGTLDALRRRRRVLIHSFAQMRYLRRRFSVTFGGIKVLLGRWRGCLPLTLDPVKGAGFGGMRRLSGKRYSCHQLGTYSRYRRVFFHLALVD